LPTDFKRVPNFADENRMPQNLRSTLFIRVVTAVWLIAPTPGQADDLHFWVDEKGVTHFTDDAESVPESKRSASSDAPATLDLETLRSAWSDGLTGSMPLDDGGDSSNASSRVVRLLRGARVDLERGEVARADATLRGVLRIAPRRPEAHWYLAELARGRGRFETAEKHLRSFLDSAGPEFAAWRAAAKARLASLADERVLADPLSLAGPLELKTLVGPHFRVQVDARLGARSESYAESVLGFLEQAREEVSRGIGVEPLEPLGVVLYGRAAYVRAHAHRFSFQTVGFFDGRIHVASPAHPTDALRGLLFHEYTHAVFREYTGGDRPYWLNEGLAEQIERRSRGRAASTRSERATLRANIETGTWVPLGEIADSFAGLSDEGARDAYLQSVVTAAFIESRTTVEQRKKLLGNLAQGRSIDQSLHEVLGLDTQGLDRAVRESIRAEFPEWGLPAAAPSALTPSLDLDAIADAPAAGG
jgi:hypothetical protein